MNPIHHPTCNLTLVAPNCNDLPIFRDADAITSFWLPEASEIEHIIAGGTVMFRCLGYTHPPISLRVCPAIESTTTNESPSFVLTQSDYDTLNTELEALRAWQAKTFDESGDSLFNVRRLRARVKELEQQLSTRDT